MRDPGKSTRAQMEVSYHITVSGFGDGVCLILEEIDYEGSRTCVGSR